MSGSDAGRGRPQPPGELEDFRRSALAVGRFDRSGGMGIDDLLDWVDELRAVFGEPPVNRSAWRGSNFRL